MFRIIPVCYIISIYGIIWLCLFLSARLLVDAIIHFGIGMTIAGAFVGIYAGCLALKKVTPWLEKLYTILLIGMFLNRLVGLIVCMCVRLFGLDTWLTEIRLE